jgi:ribosomal protein S18 acetylase RimI-like enzyme
MIVRRVYKQDISAECLSQIAWLYTRAFANDPLTRFMEPDDACREVESLALYRMLLNIGKRKGEYHLLLDTPDGEEKAEYARPNEHRVIASALWYCGKSARSSLMDMMRAGALGLLFRKSIWRLAKLARYLSEIEHVHEHDVPADHWYLAVLGVEPDMHGKKLASMLIRPFLANLDQSGMVAYLETMTAGNVQLYQHLGFRIIKEIPMGNHGLNVWAMQRDPVRQQA